MNGLKVAEAEYIHWLIAIPKCVVEATSDSVALTASSCTI